jgi:poly(3-hydroxybutyrate) depolymerase
MAACQACTTTPSESNGVALGAAGVFAPAGRGAFDAGAAGSSAPIGAGGTTPSSETTGAAGSAIAGRASFDAAVPIAGRASLDAGTISNADASSGDAATHLTQDAAIIAPTRDAEIDVPDAGARKPNFQKTMCIDPSMAQPDTDQNFPCDGLEFWVTVPKQCFTRACGLIFNIHGGAMTDHATMEQATDMIAIGSRNDFIVVHPHKPGGTWDVPNDKASVFDGLSQFITAFDVDRSHVHSTGYSQGGRLSWALACEHADVVASVAPAEENNTDSDCWKTAKLPVRELSVLFQFGMEDAIAGGFATSQTTIMQFTAAGMWSGPQTIGGASGSKWQRQRWTSAKGNVLEFISHDYTNLLIAGHCLVNPMGTTFVNCSTPVDYNWGQEVVSFFQSHPLN